MALFKREYKTTDLQAMSQAYKSNASLSSIGKFWTPISCIVASGLFGEYLYNSLFWAICWVIVSIWYSYIVLYPQEISSFYYRKGSDQRWTAVNSMHNAISNVNKDAEDIIQIGIESSEGEFKQDLQKLLAKLSLREPSKISVAFKELEDKYDEDINFTQFIEQIGIYFTMGVPDLISFNRIKNGYNKNYEIQQKTRSKKAVKKKELALALIIVFAAILGAATAMGKKNWVDSYSHTATGIITNTIIMTIAYFGIHILFFKRYYKDSVNVTSKRSFKK